MRITALVTALTLTMAPTFALAEGCGWGHKMQETAASCADGKVWDAASQACVDQTTS